MSMSKKDFIALADVIRTHNMFAKSRANTTFNPDQIETLAQFCHSQNSQFKHDRWLDYIAGECNPNGGTIKPHD